MGLSPPVLALYRQLKGLGALDDVNDVIEVGAQSVWCPKPDLVRNLFAAFGKPPPSSDMLERFAQGKGTGKELYEALGFNYRSTDLDPKSNAIPLDLNEDECPPDHKGRYDLVTNHGSSEYVLNQYNVFKIMHDLVRPKGLMLHAVPFAVQLENGYFSYQPNFFEALAKYNSYEVLGVWLGPDWKLASFIPWEPDLLDYLVMNAKTTNLLVVLLRKMYDTPFCIPFQGIYEGMIPEAVLARYCLVVDGELYDGRRARHLSEEQASSEKTRGELRAALSHALSGVSGRELANELARRIRRRLRLG